MREGGFWTGGPGQSGGGSPRARTSGFGREWRTRTCNTGRANMRGTWARRSVRNTHMTEAENVSANRACRGLTLSNSWYLPVGSGRLRVIPNQPLDCWAWGRRSHRPRAEPPGPNRPSRSHHGTIPSGPLRPTHPPGVPATGGTRGQKTRLCLRFASLLCRLLYPPLCFCLVQTLASWQSPLTRRSARELSESGIRAFRCYDCPTDRCGSGLGMCLAT